MSVTLAVFVAAVLAVSAGYYINSASGENTVTINMKVTDGTPQNGSPDQILPSSFTVTEGDHYTVIFENTDDGPHGEVIPALGFSTNVVQGGQTVRVALTPEKAGTFEYYQPSGWCQSQTDPTSSCTGPQLMNGTVTVLPP
jgi:plastocyanin